MIQAEPYLVIQAEPFGRGQPVQAAASYTVHFDDLPLLGWASGPVRARHAEFVEAYRSLSPGRR